MQGLISTQIMDQLEANQLSNNLSEAIDQLEELVNIIQGLKSLKIKDYLETNQ